MNRLLYLLLIALFPFQLAVGQDFYAEAEQLLETIDEAIDQQYHFELDDKERFNWHFTPVTRKGIDFHHLNKAGEKAGFELLRYAMSDVGYEKARGIIDLERVLFIKEGWQMRDPKNYHISIFGTPSPTGIWGWRFEGHHLSINLTIHNNKIVSSTPSFFGANPGIVSIEAQKGKQVLQKETTLGFKLVNQLGPQQLAICRISNKAPEEIITGTDRKVTELQPKGIAYTDLDEKQQTLFINLLDVYINNYEFGFASELREKIASAGYEQLYFAWAGGLQSGVGHYYRIQGPMLLIEYDNIQNNANHVHTVVRDLTNDFAEDFLKKHYQQKH